MICDVLCSKECPILKQLANRRDTKFILVDLNARSGAHSGRIRSSFHPQPTGPRCGHDRDLPGYQSPAALLQSAKNSLMRIANRPPPFSLLGRNLRPLALSRPDRACELFGGSVGHAAALADRSDDVFPGPLPRHPSSRRAGQIGDLLEDDWADCLRATHDLRWCSTARTSASPLCASRSGGSRPQMVRRLRRSRTDRMRRPFPLRRRHLG